jgi:hypothetical protein
MRFLYINIFLEMFKINNVLHLENDVMLYKIPDINSEKIGLVKDSDKRVIPSLVYIPKWEDSKLLAKYINDDKQCKNDMELLADFGNENPDKVFYFNIDPASKKELYDGAAIGQLLGGVDPRNFAGCSKGFVNETCEIKYKIESIYTKKFEFTNLKKALKVYMYNTNQLIHNLHIHCKELYNFSSIFTIKEEDIITGDRIFSLCDYILCSHKSFKYHKNLEKFNKKTIAIKDTKCIDICTIDDILNTSRNSNIRIGLYTHDIPELLKYFKNNSLYKKVTLYIHNSDDEFDSKFSELLDGSIKNITKIYAQNINQIYNEKLNYLPIGLANSMFKHGDTNSLFDVMKTSYYLKKTKNLYININKTTFDYRANVLDEVNNQRFNISSSKQFKEYLEELKTHRFSLCIRGNGIDTHRFYESLYLGVIPVIINNKYM